MVEVEGKRTKRESSKKDKREEIEEKKEKAIDRIRIKEERTREEKYIYKDINERIRNMGEKRRTREREEGI